MSPQKIMFSPVTRLSGLLSIDITVDRDTVIEANASSTMFRGFENIMRDRHITDAVYMTQRVCGICSLAHGAVSSYLLDELYDLEISENAQYLRNIMYAADFLQNHIRHFYLFSLPDFVEMPNRPPFHGQDRADLRLSPKDSERLVCNYFASIKASQKAHEILATFGGKAPHQHSFVHGGVSVAPTADKVGRALALLDDITEFVKRAMVPDTDLIAEVYQDYYRIGVTPRRLLSFGLFKFGTKNERTLWRSRVLKDARLSELSPELISEDITSSWLLKEPGTDNTVPAPNKPEAYTWVESVLYDGWHFEVGPLARMIINQKYNGGTSTMDRIYARTLETYLITQLMREWLNKLTSGAPPLVQKEKPVKVKATATTDAMRGALLHRAVLQDELVKEYTIITPTAWNFSPKDKQGQRGPAENALVGTAIQGPDMLFTVLGRIIRSFDPCMSCGTHVFDCDGNIQAEIVF